MCHHRSNQLFAADPLIRQIELSVLFLFATHEIARLYAERGEHTFQFRRSRRVLQVLDDLGLDAALAEQADRPP